jgi:hypothetical protein
MKTQNSSFSRRSALNQGTALLAAALLLPMIANTTARAPQTADSPAVTRFTSTPDIFNWNINNPQPGWEDTISWFLDLMQEEGPDFMLNAGDIMDARWWESPQQVIAKTEEYWGGYIQRFKESGMTVYFAPGDHEYGDDGGLKLGDIARTFGDQFTKIFDMPRNGPAGNIGRAYYVRKGNLLIVTLDTFVDRGDHFGYTVSDEQLIWFDQVLTDHTDADFTIVQGHLPIVGPVRGRHSSYSMLEDGTDSILWQTMVKHGVDVYLTGEHHRISVTRQDDIWQVVHGALWGMQLDLNYLRGMVTEDQLILELRQFDVKNSGEYIGNHENRSERGRPVENVTLTEYTRTRGPWSIGKLTLEKSSEGPAHVLEASGWFADK